MSDGLWMITTAERLTFTRTCQAPSLESKSFYAEPPLTFVRLKETCSAANDHLTLQPFYKLKSELKLDLNFKVIEEVLNQTNFSNIKLWEPVDEVIPKVNLSLKFNDLPDIEEMKMENLVNEINSLEEITIKEDSFWDKYKWFIIIVVIIVLFMIIVLFLSNYKRGLRFWLGNVGKNVRDSGIVDYPTDMTGHPGQPDMTGRPGQPDDTVKDETLTKTSDNNDVVLDKDDWAKQKAPVKYVLSHGLKRKRQDVDNKLGDYVSMCDLRRVDSMYDLRRVDSVDFQNPRKQLKKDTDVGRQQHISVELNNPMKNILP